MRRGAKPKPLRMVRSPRQTEHGERTMKRHRIALGIRCRFPFPGRMLPGRMAHGRPSLRLPDHIPRPRFSFFQQPTSFAQYAPAHLVGATSRIRIRAHVYSASAQPIGPLCAAGNSVSSFPASQYDEEPCTHQCAKGSSSSPSEREGYRSSADGLGGMCRLCANSGPKGVREVDIAERRFPRDRLNHHGSGMCGAWRLMPSSRVHSPSKCPPAGAHPLPDTPFRKLAFA
jgi:hypothetical protein